jgi:hypothetical protein
MSSDSGERELERAQIVMEKCNQYMVASGIIIAYLAALEELERMDIPKTDSAILRNMLARARTHTEDKIFG